MNVLQQAFNAIKDSESIPKPIRATIVTASALVFQGVFYMDRTERALTIGLTLFGGVVFDRLLPQSRFHLLQSFGGAHLLNFLLNGQPWVLLNHRLRPGAIHTSQRAFDEWMDRLQRVGNVHDSIALVAVYGPPARPEDSLGPNSDLDVRVVRYPGFMNGVLATLLICRERIRANLSLFPLDIYVFDSMDSLEQLRADETPKRLVDKEGWFDG